jgi:hypothetical protein
MVGFSSAPAAPQQPVSGGTTGDPRFPYDMQAANAMLQAGASTAPTGAWTQGMARIANALMGGYQKSQLPGQNQRSPTQGVPVASPISPGSYGPQMAAVFGTGSMY